jgi:hypothetical protein
MKTTRNHPHQNVLVMEAAVKFFNDTVLWAGWNATPEHTDSRQVPGTNTCSQNENN